MRPAAIRRDYCADRVPGLSGSARPVSQSRRESAVRSSLRNPTRECTRCPAAIEHALHARRFHRLRNQHQFLQTRISRPPHHQLHRLLPRCSQQPDDLLGIQPVEPIIVHRQNLVARRHAGFFRWRVGHSLQHHHPSWQHRYHAAEPLRSDDSICFSCSNCPGSKKTEWGSRCRSSPGIAPS